MRDYIEEFVFHVGVDAEKEIDEAVRDAIEEFVFRFFHIQLIHALQRFLLIVFAARGPIRP